MIRGFARFLPAIAVLAALAGCGDVRRSALHPAGVQAERISQQWWFFFWTTAAIYLVVMVLLAIAVARKRATRDQAPDIRPEPAREHRMARNVIIGVALSACVLFAFLIVDFLTGRAISATPQNPLTIKVTGHQWWWEIQYVRFPDEPSEGMPSGMISSANEIHVPVGTPVLLELSSQDVIHSFWIPSLHGKKDLIPGQPTTTWIRADRPGTFMGQCAEYCGAQHSNMLLWVVAEPPGEFKQWVSQQRQLVGDPKAERVARGRGVFLGYSCVMCHTIQGTPAGGRVGPDLTHVASRRRIAGGALEFNRGNLAGWIVDPQRIKPGTKMPQNTLSPHDLQELLDFIETLK